MCVCVCVCVLKWVGGGQDLASAAAAFAHESELQQPQLSTDARCCHGRGAQTKFDPVVLSHCGIL